MTAATSWVVWSVSVWLVPVYVGAMVLIFAAPRTSRPSSAREGDAGESSPVEEPLAPSSVDVKAPEPVDEPTADAPPPKPRKRKARAKKAAKGETDAVSAAAPGPAVWVRVGPGKFVRSVAPEPEPVPDEEPSQDASMDQSDQPPADEARGGEPSTPGDGLAEVVPDLVEADRDEEPSPAAPGRRRRMVEPAAALLSRRLANVRRSGATRVRWFAEAVGRRRTHVQRDFCPRSPPARA